MTALMRHVIMPGHAIEFRLCRWRKAQNSTKQGLNYYLLSYWKHWSCLKALGLWSYYTKLGILRSKTSQITASEIKHWISYELCSTFLWKKYQFQFICQESLEIVMKWALLVKTDFEDFRKKGVFGWVKPFKL